jgi:uncharacterized protein (DUF2062 family)
LENALETVKKKLFEFIKTGMTPERLALCIAVGMALGMIPALGTTTLLCTLAAFFFRLNLPAILLVNFLVYPLQLGLLFPFIRAGEWMFDAEPLNLSLELVRRMMKENLWNTVVSLFATTLHAVLAWLMIAPVMVALLYSIMTPLLRKLKLDRLVEGSS